MFYFFWVSLNSKKLILCVVLFRKMNSDDEFMLGMFGEIIRSRKRAAELWMVTQNEIDKFDSFCEILSTTLTGARIKNIWPLQHVYFIHKWDSGKDVWSFWNGMDHMNRATLWNSLMNNSSDADFNDAQNASDFFLGLSSNFGSYCIPSIFGSSELVERFDSYKLGPNRWDLWKFYHSLTADQRNTLVAWYNNWMKSRAA